MDQTCLSGAFCRCFIGLRSGEIRGNTLVPWTIPKHSLQCGRAHYPAGRGHCQLFVTCTLHYREMIFSHVTVRKWGEPGHSSCTWSWPLVQELNCGSLMVPRLELLTFWATTAFLFIRKYCCHEAQVFLESRIHFCPKKRPYKDFFGEDHWWVYHIFVGFAATKLPVLTADFIWFWTLSRLSPG